MDGPTGLCQFGFRFGTQKFSFRCLKKYFTSRYFTIANTLRKFGENSHFLLMNFLNFRLKREELLRSLQNSVSISALKTGI